MDLGGSFILDGMSFVFLQVHKEIFIAKKIFAVFLNFFYLLGFEPPPPHTHPSPCRTASHKPPWNGVCFFGA
jgi:hypothetical protein